MVGADALAELQQIEEGSEKRLLDSGNQNLILLINLLKDRGLRIGITNTDIENLLDDYEKGVGAIKEGGDDKVRMTLRTMDQLSSVRMLLDVLGAHVMNGDEEVNCSTKEGLALALSEYKNQMFEHGEWARLLAEQRVSLPLKTNIEGIELVIEGPVVSSGIIKHENSVGISFLIGVSTSE